MTLITSVQNQKLLENGRAQRVALDQLPQLAKHKLGQNFGALERAKGDLPGSKTRFLYSSCGACGVPHSLSEP
jgi:hypothetical protein